MAEARLAGEAGKGKQVVPLWEELVEQIDHYQLETWEPQLCLLVYGSLWRVIKSDSASKELAAAIFRRLCRLDPAAAIE